MPWHKFIHPDYLERTLSILSQRSLRDSSITFEQVYKHKDGGSFATIDSHTIFFSKEQPVSDLVFITLKPSAARLPSPSSRPHTYLLTEATEPQAPPQPYSPQPAYPSASATMGQISSFDESFSSPPTTPSSPTSTTVTLQPLGTDSMNWSPQTLQQYQQFHFQPPETSITNTTIPEGMDDIAQYWDLNSILQNDPNTMNLEQMVEHGEFPPPQDNL